MFVHLFMQALLPTRRFFNTLVDDHHLVVSYNYTHCLFLCPCVWKLSPSNFIFHSVKSPHPPPPQIGPPFQGKKDNKPPSNSPLLLFTNKRLTVLINFDCKTLCGLSRDGIFPNWMFGFVLDPRLHDLQLLALELFHFLFQFSMQNWYHCLCQIK